MSDMFYGATAFNQDIGDWNVANVKYMGYMFYGATAFNQDIGDWNVANVLTMTFMFNGATKFNQSLYDWSGAPAYANGYVRSMFVGTMCSNRNDPTPSNPNWCQPCS
jgi:surface protein